MRTAPGTSSCNSSSRFAASSTAKKLTPVRLPPGRARLATRPSFTGSSPILNTIGLVAVAALACNAVCEPQAAITETPRRTSSPASTGSRSVWFSAQRYSIAMFSPSTKPASLRPWRNARSASANGSADWALRNPTTNLLDDIAAAPQQNEEARPIRDQPSNVDHRLLNEDRLQPRDVRERNDANSIGNQDRIGTNVQRILLALQSLNGRRNNLCLPDFRQVHLNRELAGRCLNFV